MSEQKKLEDTMDEAQLLTASEILLGGEEGLKRIELESVKKNGKPGVVWLKPLPAREILAFSNVPKEEQLEAMIPMIASAIVNKDGSAKFTKEETEQMAFISINVFTELSLAVTGMVKGLSKGDENALDEAGKDSGGTTSSGSPTNSQAN